MVIEAYREVNHRLQEKPFHALSGPPQILEDFMTLVKLSRVKKLYAALACCFRYHSSVNRSPSSNE